jgi:UDP-N-acetylmuramoyl-tripeptide--D-alanyl-D-alanine ligase
MKQFLKQTIITIITWQAKQVIKKYKPQIVGVTGSVGKTSSKDAIYTVFKKSFKVRKSDKSFNSEIGIPLTILGCPNAWSDLGAWTLNILHGFGLIIFKKKYPKWLVLEIGADRPGDISSVCKWLNPDVAVITRFSKVPVHVEFFESPEDVMKEKSNLVWALKSDGTAILNQDDEDVLAIKQKTKNKVITYGMDEMADVNASNYSILYDKKHPYTPTGIAFKINYERNSVPITLPGSIGKAHIYPLLSAAAAGISQGINLVTISEALHEHISPPGRMKLIEGNRKSIIIDDTYNSSPVAMAEALSTLEALKKKRYKIAVLGDMLEIGKYSVDEHKKVGKRVHEVAEILITVGLRSQHIAEGALEAGMSEKNIFQFEKSREAGKFLEQILEEGDVVLVKGSQGVRMEKVIEEIMAHPEAKDRLLVRQDDQWKNR